MIDVGTQQANQLTLQPFQNDWLIRAGASQSDIDSLPADLLENLYGEVIKYGPNGGSIVFLVDGLEHISSSDAARFVRDLMEELSTKSFIESFDAFQGSWVGFTDELHFLQNGFISETESLYYRLIQGLHDLRFSGNGVPITDALMIACWGLVGDGILPLNDSFEKIRPEVEAFMQPWLAKLAALQVTA